MNYVMSDIHGHYDRFRKMLEKINFSSNDNLYILGDVIDRGPKGIKTLNYIIKHSDNIFMTIGNHESLMLTVFNTKDYDEYKEYVRTWDKNGNKSTLEEWVNLSIQEREKIIKFIKNLPLEYEIKIKNKEYILTHNKPNRNYEKNIHDSFIYNYYNEEEYRLWDRHYTDDEYEKTVVFGHTPSLYLEDYEGPVKILYLDNNSICIDCGCALIGKKDRGRLGCLCLDTMEEYYV